MGVLCCSKAATEGDDESMSSHSGIKHLVFWYDVSVSMNGFGLGEPDQSLEEFQLTS